MKRLAAGRILLIAGAAAMVSWRCQAEAVCPVTIESRVEVERAELTLADLLGPDTCPQLRKAAALVSLGAAPRKGSLHAFGGGEIRRRLGEVMRGGLSAEERAGIEKAAMAIPERIVVGRGGREKSCVEISRFVMGAAALPEMPKGVDRFEEPMDCAAAHGIPVDASLELAKTAWNTGLKRWEFSLRCSRSEDCVPFLVWVREDTRPSERIAGTRSSAEEVVQPTGSARLVKAGQTATLTWDQAGIRLVVPVTCLDAGVLGQMVRVQFKNAGGILRAEVVGAGALRAGL